MVANINHGSSLYGALSYNQNKVEAGKAKVLCSNKVFENPDGSYNLHRCMESFELQTPQDITTSKPIMYVSLNPHPDDKLTDIQLSDIAREYMKKLGYGNQPYLVYKHEDIDRHHIHIVASRVKEDGQLVNDKFEKRRSKDITRSIEDKYGLHKADKKQYKYDNRIRKVDYTAGDVKKQVSNCVRGVLSSYHFQSFNEFNTLLSLYNVRAEKVTGNHNGQPYNGVVYSATNGEGEKQGNPYKSSRFGNRAGNEAIENRIVQSTEKWKKYGTKNKVKAKVSDALQKSGTSRTAFEDNLKQNGIDVVFRQNDTGRITGVTFIDHDNRAVLNGSRLGKEYSANSFESLYNEQGNNPAHSRKRQQSFPPNYEQTFSGNSNPNIIDISGGGSSADTTASSSIKKKKRKKKRRIY